MAAEVLAEDELAKFQAAHFSTASTTHFTSQFLGLEEEEYPEAGNGEVYLEEDDDDGLGYYPDGVKRTLTDEQIAIFRHSEIQTLLRKRRHAKEAKEAGGSPTNSEAHTPMSTTQVLEPVVTSIEAPLRPIIGPVMESNLEDGELEDDATEAATPPAASNGSGPKKSKKKKKQPQKPQQRQKQREPKPKGFFKQNVKPDLRKRTWDVVDRGVDGLDYDDMEGDSAARPSMAKRRQISYDD